MNISIGNLTPLISKLRQQLAKNGSFMFVLIVLAAYTFLVIRINLLNRSEPSDDAVAEKLQSVQRPTLAPDLLKKIQDLEDQNVEVQSLFKQARENPFSE